MKQTTRDRSDQQESEDDCKSNGSAAPWAKRGLAGKTSAAQTAAPDDATDRQILTVGWRAYREDRDVEDVWREVMNLEVC